MKSHYCILQSDFERCSANKQRTTNNFGRLRCSLSLFVVVALFVLSSLLVPSSFHLAINQSFVCPSFLRLLCGCCRSSVCWQQDSFTHSFIRSFVRSFVRSLIRSLVRSFVDGACGVSSSCIHGKTGDARGPERLDAKPKMHERCEWRQPRRNQARDETRNAPDKWPSRHRHHHNHGAVYMQRHFLRCSIGSDVDYATRQVCCNARMDVRGVHVAPTTLQ